MKWSLDEIANYLLSKAIMSQRKDTKPGGLINRLPAEIRKRVKELKAKHFYHPRVMRKL